MQELYTPTEKEQLIHNLKVSIVRGDIDAEKTFRRQLKQFIPIELESNNMENTPTTAPLVTEVAETQEVTVTIDPPIVVEASPTTKETPIKKKVPFKIPNLEFPDGEFCVKDIIALTGISQPIVNAAVNTAVEQGKIKFLRNQSAGRGRPTRIFVKA